MAFRLADVVIGGEIDNTCRNAVRGRLRLRGTDKILVLDLTGNCHPDLAGRRFRFEAQRPFGREIPPGNDVSERALTERLGIPGFSLRQIGPTGDMTAARKVRVADCSDRELVRRFELNEPPPLSWKHCLYLEWYSQNGRVVLEMPDPRIEFLDDRPQAGPDDAATPQEDEPDSRHGLGVTSICLDQDGEAEIHSETFFEDEEDDEPADEYGLIPNELQRQLDAQACLTDWAVRSSARVDEGADVETDIAEMELMDAVIEHGEAEPLANIFKDVVDMQPPDSLNEEQAELQLKLALGRMALFGIAMHICEHLTAHQAYRLLVEEYCQEECFHPELVGTQWVQHFDTREGCEICQAQFEREFEQHHPPGAPFDE